jgi:predicted acetyltransferase
LARFVPSPYRSYCVLNDHFEFFREGLAPDADLTLALTECQLAADSIFGVPMYTFEMRHADSGEYMGRLRLRVGWNEETIRYAGQVGYAVEAGFRGNHYAERACRLILPLVRRHGLVELWITCQPDNPASRRTLERLGAEFVEIVDVPKAYPLDAGAIRQKACYRLRWE